MLVTFEVADQLDDHLERFGACGCVVAAVQGLGRVVEDLEGSVVVAVPQEPLRSTDVGSHCFHEPITDIGIVAVAVAVVFGGPGDVGGGVDKTVNRIAMWNQSSTYSAVWFMCSQNEARSSAPSVMNVTSWSWRRP